MTNPRSIKAFYKVRDDATVRRSRHQELSATLEERVAARREESRRFQIFVLRGSEAQKALIEYAAQRERCSMQSLIEDMVMPVLEERYGDDVPF